MKLGKFNNLQYNGELYEYLDNLEYEDEIIVEALRITEEEQGFDGQIDEFYMHLFEDDEMGSFQALLAKLTTKGGRDEVLESVVEDVDKVDVYVESISPTEIKNAISKIRNSDRKTQNLNKLEFLRILMWDALIIELNVDVWSYDYYILRFIIQTCIINEYDKRGREGNARTNIFVLTKRRDLISALIR